MGSAVIQPNMIEGEAERYNHIFLLKRGHQLLGDHQKESKTLNVCCRQIRWEGRGYFRECRIIRLTRKPSKMWRGKSRKKCIYIKS